MIGAVPGWYIALQVVLFLQGISMIFFGAVMTHRRLSHAAKTFSSRMHIVVHYSLLFNGTIMILLAVDPIGVRGIWPYWLLPCLKTVVNIVILCDLLLWTSILLGGLKEVEGMVRDTKTLELFLWKLPSAVYTISCVVSMSLAISLNRKWPMAIQSAVVCMTFFVALVVSSKALKKVREVYHSIQSQDNQRTRQSNRKASLIKLLVTVLIFILEFSLTAWNCYTFLSINQSLEASEIPHDPSKPAIPWVYLMYIVALPMIFYMFWVPSAKTGLSRAGVSGAPANQGTQATHPQTANNQALSA
jgi:hypothetical protein